MKTTLRVFVGIDATSSIRSSANRSLSKLRRNFPEVAWSDDSLFHVTVKFLGDVALEDLNDVISALRAACKEVAPFQLTFQGFGVFPNVSRPRVVWIGVDDPDGGAVELAERVDLELSDLGFPPTDNYRPHLTVGRIKSKTSAPTSLAVELEKEKDALFGSVIVDYVTLYSSERNEAGKLVYAPLAEIELGDPDEDMDELVDSFGFEEETKSPKKDSAPRSPIPNAVKLDFAALDADLDEELRALCGDKFVDDSKRKKKR